MAGPVGEARSTAILVGPDLAKAADHIVALREFGLETVLVADPSELTVSAVASSVVVAPVFGFEDCGAVSETVRLFPAAVIVALLPRLTARSVRAALRCGACTAVEVNEPALQAAETVYQASIGFPRFPAWLLRAGTLAAPTGSDAQDVAWLELLADPGLTMADIAGRVGWSRAELYRRLRPLYRRLGAASRHEAVDRARGAGLLP